MAILSKIFGDANARYIGSLQNTVEKINSLEKKYEVLSEPELINLTGGLKKRLQGGETLEDILPEAFAAVREAAKRKLKMRHFDVQLVGGMVLHEGKIAEMKTGEGKTLVATLPLYLNSLSGRGSHLITPNDYLSRIGAGWMGPLYSALGISTGVITHEFSGIYDPEFVDSQPHGDERLSHFRPVARSQAYEADITYGTNNEFGFDYLRDNLEYSPGELRQTGHNYAIVDEIDSILIDEARTPLIISAPDEESADLYRIFARITPQLKESSDYNVDEKLRAVSMTEEGIDKLEKILGVGNIYEEKGIRFVRHLEQALRAQALFQRDKDYVVRDGEVLIVDEFTGRLMPGRRWSEGLHQAIEAKEGVMIQKESRTLATITFQNYFRMYKKLAGMTGTAQTSAEEFHKVYNLDVISIPTNKPMVRKDQPDQIFRTEKGKFQAVAAEIKKRNEKGQPVLVGTVSIEKNEKLSRMLEVEGIKHELLNAKNHEREALIIAQAGKISSVTVATNMAGRGVDIILGGSAPDSAEAEEVRSIGGLYVIGTERHEARRIDNQLRGRSGRQGDPGCSQFFVSLEDDLMRIFGSEKIKRLMETLGIPENEPIENKMVSRAIESAQGKIEGFHFDSRKHILEFDDVLNKQRDATYRMRKEILFANEIRNSKSEILNNSQNPNSIIPETAEEFAESETQGRTLKERIFEMTEDEVGRIVEFHTRENDVINWNLEEIFESLRAMGGITGEERAKMKEIANGNTEDKREKMKEYLAGQLKKGYEERAKELGDETVRGIERSVMLRAIDFLWMDHLDQMEHLRDSVRLRAYGQRDPLVEYKHEGSRLFRELQAAIQSQIVNTIFKINAAPAEEKFRGEERRPEMAGIMNRGLGNEETNSNAPRGINNSASKEIGRNDPCPCGSGKKYKKCHGQ